MLFKFVVFILTFFISIIVYAQKAQIKGTVTDSIEKKNLQYSSVLLIRKTDSILVKSTRTEQDGTFELKNIPQGKYQLLISYPKMADYVADFNLTDSSKIDLGKINMDLKSFILNEVVVKATKNAVRMRGDTLVFQADSFQVKPNANVQDLLKRLPGIQIDKNGKIKAEGKDVKTVLVDGDEFFGDDPLMATKYLKANAVDEVQVYDKKSKSADLTGIDDGNKEKTINIKLKENAKNGYLSAFDLNSNLSKLYDYGAMIGVFKNKLKTAVYSTKSTLNLSSKAGQAFSRLKGDEYDMIEVGDDGSTMAYMSNDYEETDFSGGSGLPNNFSLGAHFSNKWNAGKKSLKLNYKSYDNKNLGIETSASEELLPNGTRFISTGTNNSSGKVTGQDLRSGFEIKLDSLSTLKINIGANKGKRTSSNTTFNETHNDANVNISQNLQDDLMETNIDGNNGNINYTRKFRKKGRTLLIDLQPEIKTNSSSGSSINTTQYYNEDGSLNRIEKINLNKINSGDQQSLGTRINYTEPISKRWLLETGYSFKGSASSNNKQVYDGITNSLTKIDSLSNNFNFNSFSNLTKVIIQYKTKLLSFSTGLEATQTNLKLEDVDRSKSYDRNYLNLSPRTNFNINFSKTTRISINYNGYTRQPSLDQLQPVRAINNPLYQVVGNTNLKPAFHNSISVNLGSYDFSNEQYISGYLSYSSINNDIVNSTSVDQSNKRVTSFVNINGNKNFNGSINYSKGFNKIHTRIDLNLNYNQNERNEILNAVINTTKSRNYTLSSNISYYTDKLEVYYNPSVNFSDGFSTIGSVYTGKNVEYSHELSSTIQLPYKLEFNVSTSFKYQPANAAFINPVRMNLLNSYLSAKLLKTENLIFKISVNDILKQRVGYNRSISGNNISENTYSIIPRYVLLSLNYSLLGNFSTTNAKK